MAIYRAGTLLQHQFSHALVIPVTTQQMQAYVWASRFSEYFFQESPQFPEGLQPAYFPFQAIENECYGRTKFPFLPITTDKNYQKISPGILQKRRAFLLELLPEISLDSREARIKTIKGFLEEEKMADGKIRHFTGSLDEKAGMLKGIWENYMLKRRIIKKIEESTYAEEFLAWLQSEQQHL